jgi:hypothetical protein
MHRHFLHVLCLLVTASTACSTPTPPFVEPPPSEVSPVLPPALEAERARLLEEIAALDSLTTDELLADRAVPYETLGYDPTAATNLDSIQSSSLALRGAELERLATDGFVVADRVGFPTFAYGYETIYGHDLPVFISADSVLEAVHRSYDDILRDVEGGQIVPELTALLGGMKAALAGEAGRALPEDVRAHVDLYLAVALGLLEGGWASCVAGCNEGDANQLIGMARAHEGSSTIALFGSGRTVDFSQFTPRGHYADDGVLSRYFAAMMWLGRIDFRLIETQRDHIRLFRRRQLEAAIALRSLLDETRLSQFDGIDAVITAFVGEHDYMRLREIDQLMADLGISDLHGLDAFSDEELARAIIDGGYGARRIASHIMINGLGQGTMPLSSSFALFGQRYVVDSHVLSNVVYDRVGGGSVRRMMPSPADVLYAALGNDQAAALLEDELRAHPYAPDLEAMRLLVDAHEEDYWKQDLYTSWLGALRTLSPRAAGLDPDLPSVARTEPWGRRLAVTQLASWAELRHNTVLYVAQSFTGGIACEFPDGYVEPYPEFFDGIAELGRRGAEATALIDASAPAHGYFVRLEEIATMLGDMARHQRTGMPYTESQLAFLNRAVRITAVCGAPESVEGWYGDLHYSTTHGAEWDPTITDVHTQPTDAGGVEVGRVLHVATGRPRLAIFTFETCSGPRAYAGVVSSYFERVTEGYERLTDEAWAQEIDRDGHPAEPAYLGGIAVRR